MGLVDGCTLCWCLYCAGASLLACAGLAPIFFRHQLAVCGWDFVLLGNFPTL